MSASEYFNPIPLFILFREAIEASIVVSVLLTFVARSSVPGLKAQSECAVRCPFGFHYYDTFYSKPRCGSP